MLKITTWNVNGIRAREAPVLEWIERERPDVVCLQELKSTVAQVPAALCELQGYRCYWHGARAYAIRLNSTSSRHNITSGFHSPMTSVLL